jgi:tetratricopeptide (TPR) repeat protein
MYSLIAFATQWGSKHGGINSFNTDFLEAFGIAYHASTHVICIVADATDDEIEKARNAYVTLIKLPYPPQTKTFSKSQALAGINLLKQKNINFNPANTIWLGHDLITGEAAIEAAKNVGGRSALIHHMSYAHYESFAEDSETANAKNQVQQALFKQSDLILAIGPLLRDAAHDLVSGTKPVHMLVPGLSEIETKAAPKTFVAFLGGRLSGDAARVKQGYLSIAALAHAHKEACKMNMPEGLCKQPRLTLRGVDFSSSTNSQPEEKPEAKLKAFAEKIAERALNILALPYTHDRTELHDEISRSSAVMMLSWHEGFGLSAWEAIAAGVPLILSKQSGVYKLLEEMHPGCEKGFINPIDVRGKNTEPFYRDEDLEAAATALREIAHHPEKARQKAGTLRGLLLNHYTWPACAERTAEIFSWPLSKGILPAVEQKQTIQSLDTPASAINQSELPVHMPTKRLLAGDALTDSQLLRAEEALVPFDLARQPELDKLDAWLNDGQYLQTVRLVTGAGGLGKTRLALHLCEQRSAAGWYSGFLDSDLTQQELTAGWKVLQALNQPLLIIIDYAETRQNDLIVLIKAMQKSPSKHPVRFLLLARDGGEWWDNLPSRDKDCEALLSGYATSGPFSLPTLHDEIPDRLQAYKEALNAFAKALEVPAPSVTPELAGEHFGRPLYLQMAALLALRGERPTTAQGLTRALLNHERRYWKGLFVRSDFPEPDRHAEQLLALVTLAGGFTTAKFALPHWERANGKTISAAQFSQLFHTLIPLYPGKQGLQAVRPDLLGEALVAQALLRPSADELLNAVLGKEASFAMRWHALTVIARLSDHYQELHEVLIEALKRCFVHCWQEFLLVATETPSNLPSLAEIAFARLSEKTKSQVAGLLKSRIAEESVQLAGYYCLIYEYLVKKARQKHPQQIFNTESMSDLAGKLNDYSITLYRAGRNDGALDCAKQSLEIRQRLSEKNPGRFDSDLAMSLNTYANRLGNEGFADDALVIAEQSLKIYQRLAKTQPEHFDSDLALSLNNYSNRLSNVDRNNEALENIRESLEIYQRLAQKRPDRFEPDRAMSLINYSNSLGRLGQIDKALLHAKQALEIYQPLSKKKPDRFDPDCATSLYNCATCLCDAGYIEEALEHSRQALKLFMRLSQKNPARYSEEHFSSYCNTRFLEWLAGNNPDDYDLEKLSSIPEVIPPHLRPLLQHTASFVRACCITTQTSRSLSFKQTISLWGDLSPTNKISALHNWLCASAWCATHTPALITDTSWKEKWIQFTTQRQGHIPWWMLEVAKRLHFKWPE